MVISHPENKNETQVHKATNHEDLVLISKAEPKDIICHAPPRITSPQDKFNKTSKDDSPVTFMGRPELLNIISTRSASTGIGHVMTVPPPWILLKGSMGKGGISDRIPSCRTFKAVGDDAVGGRCGAKGEKAAAPWHRNKARTARWNFMVFFYFQRKRNAAITTTTRTVVVSCTQATLQTAGDWRFAFEIIADVCRKFRLSIVGTSFRRLCGGVTAGFIVVRSSPQVRTKTLKFEYFWF